jgi:hypothetical protein
MISLLAVLVSIVTACILLYAAYINDEKIRLNLYNKRFEVYSVTIDFYQALSDLKYDQELPTNFNNMHLKFIKSCLESHFLFKQDVYDVFKKMNQSAHDVIADKQHAKDDAEVGKILYVEGRKASEYWNEKSEALGELLFEYLDFQELSPRKRIQRRFCKRWCKN